MNHGERRGEEEPVHEELRQLAQKMRRTPESMQAFARLTPEQLLILLVAVDRACERHRREFDEAASPALLRPLRRLLLHLLRGRQA